MSKYDPGADKLRFHSGRDDWLVTYKRVEEVIEDEGMKGEIGRPFDWMVDLLKAAKRHIEILNQETRRQKRRTYSTKENDADQ